MSQREKFEKWWQHYYRTTAVPGIEIVTAWAAWQAAQAADSETVAWVVVNTLDHCRDQFLEKKDGWTVEPVMHVAKVKP